MLNDALVVGLGNPGPKYEKNRHNFGFFVVDTLAARFGASFREKFRGAVARVHTPTSGTVTLQKPFTYMNLSGQSVSRAVQFFNISVSSIIVVHDELDLPFGTIKIKNGGGTAGHKGLTSMKQELQDAGFLRVRMGIGRPAHGSVSDYVLSDFNASERAELADIVDKGADAAQMIIDKGCAFAMNHFNRKDP